MKNKKVKKSTNKENKNILDNIKYVSLVGVTIAIVMFIFISVMSTLTGIFINTNNSGIIYENNNYIYYISKINNISINTIEEEYLLNGSLKAFNLPLILSSVGIVIFLIFTIIFFFRIYNFVSKNCNSKNIYTLKNLNILLDIKDKNLSFVLISSLFLNIPSFLITLLFYTSYNVIIALFQKCMKKESN